jgi:hypothetical protein
MHLLGALTSAEEQEQISSPSPKCPTDFLDKKGIYAHETKDVYKYTSIQN